MPDQFADEISLVGPIDRIRDRVQAWKHTPVSMIMVVSQGPSSIRTAAEVVLG